MCGAANMTRAWGLILAVSLAAGGSPVAWGQIQPLQGNAIDANNQVGSMGLNYARPYQDFNSADLYVTGNVTGGRGFRGFSPVRNSNALFTGIPSAAIASFRADAISAGDVLMGRSNYTTSPYFAESNTVANAGIIARGFNQPGSSILTTRFMDPNRAATTTTRSLTSSLATSITPGVPFQSTAVDLGLDDINAYASSPVRPLMVPTQPAAPTLTQSPLFNQTPIFDIDPWQANGSAGLATLPVEQAVTPEPVGLTPGEPPGLGTVNDVLERESALVSPADLAPRVFGTPVRDARTEAEPGGGIPTLESSTRSLQPEVTTLGATPREQQEPAATDTYEPEGQSAYRDFVNAVEWLQRIQADSEAPTTESLTPQQMERLDEATAVAREMIGQTLQTYAGHVESDANHHIMEAERLAREGKYYRAADQYEMALSIERDNALVRLGLGHAYLFAGDFRTAALHLAQGISRFDGIRYFDIDLTRFVPDPSVLEVRRAMLEQQLEQREDYQLRFLLGYSEYYSGLKQFGLPDLKKAAEEALRVANAPRVSPAEQAIAQAIADFPRQLTDQDNLLPPRDE